MSDEDDKATVVIDLKKFQKDKEKQEKELAAVAEDLEFNLSSHESEETSSTLPVVMFEFGKNHFSKLKEKLPLNYQYHFVSELPELNAWIKKKVPFVLCLPFDVNPKAINQLCVQLRAKYPHISVVLVGQGLTPDKIALHQKSSAKASAYMGYPFAAADFNVVLERFNRKKAA